MSVHLRRSLLSLSLLVLPLLAASCSFTVHKRSIALSVDHVDDRPLVVRTSNGSVRIANSENDSVQIHAEVGSRSKERLALIRIDAGRAADGTLLIRPVWPGGSRENGDACSFRIDLPSAGDIDVETHNGKVVVEGVGRNARLRTSNGRIRARGLEGSVSAVTSNGSVRAEAIAGSVDLQSSNGSIEIAHVSTPVRAHTSNGSVKVTHASCLEGPLDIQSSNGSIELDLVGLVGEMTLRTSNGRVSVDAPADFELERSSKSRAALRSHIGQGVSQVRTSNGSIRVRVRKEAAQLHVPTKSL